jgi:hypothetical protein
MNMNRKSRVETEDLTILVYTSINSERNSKGITLYSDDKPYMK